MIAQSLIDKARLEILPGAFYLVATPIGNLADVTLRALATLAAADIVCAEDTRVTRKLLALYGLDKETVSVREHNEAAMAERVCAWLGEGKVVAMACDAGTPGICDPGARVARAARAQGHRVVAIPGPSAAVTALCVAAVDSESFRFLGFLPAKAKERERALQSMCASGECAVFYESPHRIKDTLKQLAPLAGDRPLTLARELTKAFETVVESTAGDLARLLDEQPLQAKGEMALVLHPAAKKALGGGEDAKIRAEKLAQTLAREGGASAKTIAVVLRETLGMAKNEAYAIALGAARDR